MPLNLVKRGEKLTPITIAEHDANMTSIETIVASLEAQIVTINAGLASVGAGTGAKLANVVEDLTPELGGDLNGLNRAAYNVRVKIVSKTASFTASPTEGNAYNIQAVGNVTLTLPSSLITCPVGTGFEIHVEQGIQVSVVTSSGNINHVVNFNGHRKLIGPHGVGFVRVLGPDGSDAVWKLAGNTAA